MLYKIKRVFYYLFHHPVVLVRMLLDFLAPIMPDELFLKVKFHLAVGYILNLKNPKTFNQKLQWLKLNDIHLEYTKMVDRVAAKEYVASIIGEKYIIPTLGVWNNVNEVNWESLP